MTEQQTNWLEAEAKLLTTPTAYEELPNLKLTPNQITELDVDASKPFQEWNGEDAKGKPVKKKIILVSVNGTRMNWWLNVKNPVYREIVNALLLKQIHFKVLQTGTQANTKYVLVK